MFLSKISTEFKKKKPLFMYIAGVAGNALFQVTEYKDTMLSTIYNMAVTLCMLVPILYCVIIAYRALKTYLDFGIVKQVVEYGKYVLFSSLSFVIAEKIAKYISMK